MFGDNGELRPILNEDASNEAIEDGIAVLERRRCAIEASICGLRELLARRRGEPLARPPTSFAQGCEGVLLAGLGLSIRLLRTGARAVRYERANTVLALRADRDVTTRSPRGRSHASALPPN